VKELGSSRTAPGVQKKQKKPEELEELEERGRIGNGPEAISAL
jgi:hypothetical protein